ncbi:MAG: helix-turn-helix transcriptional regulator [Clostridia bacterium]|nr:helix-turn-helix transcriptional regulator [Clostridia bacterium]
MSIKMGENIAYYRKKKGMTQEELGELLNVSGQAVSKWENGGVPDIGLLPELAKIFDVSIDALFGRKKKISETTKDEILTKLFKYCSYHHVHQKETFDSFQFLFECIWSIQSAYLGNEELHDYNEILERYKFNPQITSQIITDEGTTYLSLVKGFPLFCAVKDSPEISKKILNEESFGEFFSLLASDYGMKAVLFTQKTADQNQYTGKTIAEKMGISEKEFEEVRPLLVQYGLLREETLLLDDNQVKIYRRKDNPELRPILMMAYQFIHAKQCYFHFQSFRTEPYLKEVADED